MQYIVIDTAKHPTGQSYVQWTSFYVFADVEKTYTEEPELKFLGRLFLTCSARPI